VARLRYVLAHGLPAHRQSLQGPTHPALPRAAFEALGHPNVSREARAAIGKKTAALFLAKLKSALAPKA
jgi:hypothetical protein